MRCYLRAFLLCTAFAFVSLLYVFTLEDSQGRGFGELTIPDGGSHDGGNVVRKSPGLAGREPPAEVDRCKSQSVSHWDPYWRPPADVCGLNCFLESSFRDRAGSKDEKRGDESSHLAVVACGPRLEETLTMLKSAVMFSKKPVKFYIFAEDQLHHSFRDALILKEVDSLLYVDTDVLFLQPVEDIWALLAQFNASQLAAMAPEHEEPRIGWYNRFARHPYYGQTGVNSGVMLMNMTRLRETFFKNDMTSIALKWSEMLMPLLHKYKLNITWGDQDLLNIIFHHNPESLYVFPCQWNYRPDHCVYGSNCQQAEEEGVFILHGNRGVYHNEKQPAFRAVYEAIKQFSFGDNMESSLLQPLEASLQTTGHSYCGRVSHLFTKRLKQRIASRHTDKMSTLKLELGITE
ncbi:glucoside xylosyltransferase 1-like isoform X2 [Dunckerocampus dactyliophorus]|uniref:glucoside xylosyltransferase 1-like isoform X2 n=1 Tax=Dunckerocampus dactyliophorus TaxID=161453 RepID=UPI0024054B34|nr:glucoside xylosyltransferase 1-like isoform X2 [Dunckerocampus dactyliophorus]